MITNSKYDYLFLFVDLFKDEIVLEIYLKLAKIGKTFLSPWIIFTNILKAAYALNQSTKTSQSRIKESWSPG